MRAKPMGVIVILILASLAVAVCFLAGFVWAVRTGQFEDVCTPSLRILADDLEGPPPTARASAPRPKRDAT